MSVFNEIVVSLYLYLLLCLTDFSGLNPFRDEVGWALLILVIFTVFVNIVKTTWVDFLYIRE